MSFKLIERNTPCWRLFNLLYDVYVPELSLYSTEYLRNNSINITGDTEVDNLRINQLTQTRMTPAGIAMIVMEGYEFGLVKYEDCVQIFSDIQGHLNNWREETKMFTHPDDFPPIEELRAFEAVALTTYNHAMRLNPVTQDTGRLFNALVNMNRNRNLKSTNKWLNERIQEDKEFKPYVSIVDDIEFYVVENGDSLNG